MFLICSADININIINISYIKVKQLLFYLLNYYFQIVSDIQIYLKMLFLSKNQCIAPYNRNDASLPLIIGKATL